MNYHRYHRNPHVELTQTEASEIRTKDFYAAPFEFIPHSAWYVGHVCSWDRKWPLGTQPPYHMCAIPAHFVFFFPESSKNKNTLDPGK